MKLQIQLTGQAESLLKEMAKTLDVKPREVVLDALALYHFALEQAGEGKKIGSVDPDTKEFTAVATPSLQAIGQSLSRRGELQRERQAF